MKQGNLKEAIALTEEIRKLKYFTENINCRWGNTKMIVKKKCKVSYSIFGSRSFGMGSHTEEIEVPKSLIAHVDAAVMEWLEERERQLENL